MREQQSLPQEPEKIAADTTLKDDAKTQTDVIDLTGIADLEFLEIQ
ncbi:MAG: hypothetical protein HUU08_17365 [Candidatus Brocadia sp.]|nr:hypothetical protein [Candidatus Brocadia sp.]UJS18235.1 MAG: hypothetical protein L3J17_04020 [Candidatus Jettenia sp.]